jgi:hypothetical protein
MLLKVFIIQIFIDKINFLLKFRSFMHSLNEISKFTILRQFITFFYPSNSIKISSFRTFYDIY